MDNTGTGVELLRNLVKAASTQQAHDRRVRALISYFIHEYRADEIYADLKNHPKPVRVGRHIPDVSARKNKIRLALGEAKRIDDIDSERSREQYIDFSENLAVKLVIALSPAGRNKLEEVLEELGLLGQPNISILEID